MASARPPGYGQRGSGEGDATPARTGAEFLARLAAARTHAEACGETLRGGVGEHPAFRITSSVRAMEQLISAKFVRCTH